LQKSVLKKSVLQKVFAVNVQRGLRKKCAGW